LEVIRDNLNTPPDPSREGVKKAKKTPFKGGGLMENPHGGKIVNEFHRTA